MARTRLPMRENVVLSTRGVHTRTRDAPLGRQLEPRPSSTAQVIALPRVGGPQHRYAWAEAA